MSTNTEPPSGRVLLVSAAIGYLLADLLVPEPELKISRKIRAKAAAAAASWHARQHAVDGRWNEDLTTLEHELHGG